MNTSKYTFMDIFNPSGNMSGEEVKVNRIVIPIIQRDYAQGRKQPEINRVRKRFLDSLYRVIKNNQDSITLDFVYGDVDEKGVMTPLDGQQRLTTLFLLHWYAAKKESIPENEYEWLKEFSYDTRYSAREFCKLLINYNPFFEGRLSDEIVEQSWFPLEWEKDPTVSSMLVVLDDIADIFKDTTGIWERLKEGAISFYFLPIKDMGLTDELYIKMNSRGKPLTPFEHFKAELERKLKSIDSDRAKDILYKIDIRWTNMLWMYRGDNNIIDDEFLRYFKFICDIICYKEGGTPQGRSDDEFFLLDTYFDADVKNVESHIDLLEEYFDCWCELDGNVNPKEFQEKYISNEHEPGKIMIRGEIDVFLDCLNNYGETTGRNRRFPLNKVVLLYAIIAYLLNRDKLSSEDFIRRLRVVNNLIRNSEDEISDSENRSSGNRMPVILKQIDSIIIEGNLDSLVDKGLNAFQLDEEKIKSKWISEHDDKKEVLYELEDHYLLNGQIGIIGLDHIDLSERFKELFRCDLDLIDSALMTINNYGQKENDWRYLYGTSNERYNKAWQDLFHKNSNENSDLTHEALITLLEKSDHMNDELLQKMVKDFLHDRETSGLFDIRYYYVKYKSFRPGAYGKYAWWNYNEKPYELRVMKTGQAVSQNSYQPFLFEIDSEKLNRDECGKRLDVGENYVLCHNDAYVIYSINDDSEIDRVEIMQNEDGIDVEDRILKFRNYYKNKM